MVEITIIFAIMAVMLLIVWSFTSAGVNRGDLRDATTQAVDLIRRAQWQSMNGLDDDTWSVHFETTQMVLFKGGTYSAMASDNIVTTLPSHIEVSSISLTGGGDDIIFDDEFGNTSTDGTITFTNTTNADTDTITINSVGMVDRSD